MIEIVEDGADGRIEAVEMQAVLIPGHNDSDEELDRMTGWVVEHLGNEAPMHFSAFHPAFKMVDIPPPPPRRSRARRIAMRNGVHYAYTGNVHDIAGGNTYCNHCATRLITRDSYVITQWTLGRNGCCQSCGESVPGVFESSHGTWGAKRMPVDLQRLSA